MEPLTMLLLGGALSAGTSAVGGALQRRASRQAAAELLTDEERERLAELQRRQAAGELGLTEAQELDLDAVLRAQRAASSRASQAERLQQQAATPASARNVFLQQMAAAAQLAAGGAGTGLTQAGAQLGGAIQQAAALDTGMSTEQLLQLYQSTPVEGGTADMSAYV